MEETNAPETPKSATEIARESEATGTIPKDVNVLPMDADTPDAKPATAPPVELIPAELKPGTIPTTAVVTPAPEKKTPPPEIKIVITLKTGRAIVGFQRTGTDPILSMVEGSLPVVLNRIPALLVEASKSWAKSLKMPTTTYKPTPPPAPVHKPYKPSAPAKPAAPKEGNMKSMM